MEYLTLREAAEKYGYTPAALKQASFEKRLETVKRGRDLWVTDVEMIRYKATSKRGRPRKSPHP